MFAAKGVLFVATRVCARAAARCYSGSRDQVEIDQKREYISVNGKAAFSSLQTMCDDAVSQCVTDLLR